VVSRVVVVVVLVLLALPAVARADTRGVLRFGVLPVDLVTSSDTPVLGTRVDDAVGAYNLAVGAYNQAHGYSPGSPMASATIHASDLGVHATLYTIAPALEAGHPNVYVRIEALLGFGDSLRTYGVGFYPLNLAAKLGESGAIVVYLSAGGSAGWLERSGQAGTLGALISARGAIGVRVERRVTVELGYAAYVLGGVVDRGRINEMQSYDPSGSAPPDDPEHMVAGGEQRGRVDVSVGMAF
jgi:hypothetical protein